MTVLAIILIIVVSMFFFMSRNKSNVRSIGKRVGREFETGNEDKIDIVHISDIHYLSPKLTDYGKSFSEISDSDDGKVIKYTDQLMDAFVYEMIKRSPDLVIISGDLTYNGEKKSHEDLAKKLKRLKDKGIKTIVIPGNHDINNQVAKSFFEDREEPVESVSSSEFQKIYNGLGYGDDVNVVSRAKHSLSYIYKIRDDFNVIMLDTSTDKNNKYITNSLYKWLEKELKFMKDSNERAISVTHQNILAHNKMFISGYKIENSSKLVELYSRFNIRLNLSGHMHIQHISEKDGVYDAAVSALSIYPIQYAEIQIDLREKIEYRTLPLNVAEWVEIYGKSDRNLQNFHKYAKEYFIESIKAQTVSAIKNIDIDENKKYKMINFIVETNLGYFSGRMDEYPGLSIKSDSYALWQKYCQKNYLSSYLNSVYIDKNTNHNKLSISQ